ncbi:HIT family protein [Rhizobium sp. A37_96]
MPSAPELLITETDGWIVSHRVNSSLPGYLIIASKRFASDLSELPDDTLRELGPLLALTQILLRRKLNARRVYIGRYGHVPGQSFHFHIIPIYPWVEELFWLDERYRVLQQFTEGTAEETTDGAELTLFAWREFCERLQPPLIKGPTVPEVVELLKKSISSRPSPINL